MITRRAMLAGAAGCCAAAAPGVGPLAFAAARGERRLVVIILRGAMDGLGLVQPWDDPDFRALRPGLALTPDTGLTDLDGRHGLWSAGRPGGGEMLALWRAEELAFVQAVSTPYRDERSHFVGQDMLETGNATAEQRGGGWLPRALALVPGAGVAEAVTMSPTGMLLGRGDPSAVNWSPWVGLDPAHPLRASLRALHAADPAFRTATEDAFRIADEIAADGTAPPERPHLRAAHAVVRMLAGAARVAAFSLGGWDTHVGQQSAMRAPVAELGEVLGYLRRGLGPAWGETAVICMTEFGRTARENGIGGTDHGTGGLAVLAGGAVRGGRIHGAWPGLGEGDLLDDRDLRPSGDVRLYAALLIHQLLGAPLDRLAREVFPGIDTAAGTDLLA